MLDLAVVRVDCELTSDCVFNAHKLDKKRCAVRDLRLNDDVRIRRSDAMECRDARSSLGTAFGYVVSRNVVNEPLLAARHRLR